MEKTRTKRLCLWDRGGNAVSYDIQIGEACLEDMSYDKCAGLRVWAKRAAHDDAPTFENDDMTANGNCRRPGYSAWSEFCRETGLYAMFFGLDGRRNPYMRPDEDNCHRETPLLAEHPGFQAINKYDVEHVKERLDAYRAKYPNAKPGFDTWSTKDEDARPIEDAHMASLIWLHYWMDWAVKTCAHPIVANS